MRKKKADSVKCSEEERWCSHAADQALRIFVGHMMSGIQQHTAVKVVDGFSK